MSDGYPITGVGAVASIGRDAEEIYQNLCKGVDGLAPLRGFTRRWYKAGHLFEVDNRPEPGADEPRRATALLLDAVGQAAADAGLGESFPDVPVIVGTGLRELRSVELWWRDGVPVGHDDLHFGTALRQRFGTYDTHTIANACSASLYALALAVDLLDSGVTDTVIVAGVDVITESMFGLSDRVQPEPPGRVAPFDQARLTRRFA
jgi:3-oxoacyl-[acyl-carrier-protein] synthase II